MNAQLIIEEPLDPATVRLGIRAAERPDLRGRRVLVLGLGETGVSAARFLATRGAQVCLQDDAPEGALAPSLARVQGLIAESRVGGAVWPGLEGFDLVLPSPGVPVTAPLLIAAAREGVPVWSEIELASRFLDVPLIAVTGSNGKSTTTTLIGEMMRAGGGPVFVGGNLGTPLIDCADGSKPAELAVAEISSFQLEHVESFRPGIALLLNLSEDHLDRHGSFEAYVAAKARIFARQAGDDVLIYNADDVGVVALARTAPARRLPFSLSGSLSGAGPEAGDEGISLQGDSLLLRLSGAEERYPVNEIRIQGAQNIENAMAAVLAARVAGASPDLVRRILGEFPGLPHRLERVRVVDGVAYYDDSKATNPGAAVRAITGFSSPVILIAGGKDKACRFEPLREAVSRHARAVVLIGEAAPRIKQALGGVVPCIMAQGMADAVAKAHETAEPGDIVLLAPACASFDMFSGYAERGERFAAVVRSL